MTNLNDPAPNEPAIFDGHNDVLLKLYNNGLHPPHKMFLQGGDSGQLDLPRMVEGGFGGGFFAIYIPSPADVAFSFEEMNKDKYDLPLPPQIDQRDGLAVVMAKVAILKRLERAANGKLKVCHSAGELRSALENGVIGVVLHIEGAEAIDVELNALEVLYHAGLRSVGPVWSRPTSFAHGVPFRYPSSPDIGPGLTDIGKELIRACNEFHMMVDLSHLNEKGFWDVAKISDAPLIATHSNAHALCPNSRNLTDKQLAAIAESNGMVGVNFANAFIRPDGKMRPDTPLELLLAHIDHFIEILGEDRVGFGSDFDGAMVPEAIGDVVGLVPLRAAMRAHGYNETLMKKLCHENWLNALERTFGN